MQETTQDVALGMWETDKPTVSASPMLQGLPAGLFGTRKELQNTIARLAIILVVGVGFGGFVWFLFCFSLNCELRRLECRGVLGTSSTVAHRGEVTGETAEDTVQGTEQKN